MHVIIEPLPNSDREVCDACPRLAEAHVYSEELYVGVLTCFNDERLAVNMVRLSAADSE
jgi:hypothetical protein